MRLFSLLALGVFLLTFSPAVRPMMQIADNVLVLSAEEIAKCKAQGGCLLLTRESYEQLRKPTCDESRT